jgi:PAS domain S-box-containing protein
MKEQLTDAIMYKAIFDLALAGFFVVDDKGYILKANAAGEHMFGYEAGELLNKKIEVIFPKEYKEEYTTLLKKSVSEPVQILTCRKDGTIFITDIVIGLVVIEGTRANTVYCKASDTSVLESDRKLRTLVDNASGIVYRCKNDRDWTIEYISEGCERITGYSSQEFLQGKVHFSHITSKEDYDQVQYKTQEALGKKEPFDLTYCIRDKTGNKKYLNELGRGIFDANGDLQCLEGFITDITDQKETEYALKKEKETLSHYLNVAASIFLIINTDHTIELINRKGCEVLGYRHDEIIGKNWFYSCIPKKHKKELMAAFDLIVKGAMDSPDIYENWVLSKGGKRKLIQWRNALLKDENGTVTGLISSGVDVTEQVVAEQKLRDSEEKNRAILSGFPDVITIHDSHGNVIEISSPNAPYLIAPKEEFENKKINNLFSKDVGGELKNIFTKVLRTQQMETLEVRASVLNGMIDYECRFVPLSKNRILTICRNISETKAIQNTLNLRNRALEAAGNGIIISDAQQPGLPIIYSNGAFTQMTGYEQSEILGRNCRFLQHDDRDQEEIKTLAIAIQQGKPCRVILRNYRKDGSLFWNELTITPLYNEDQKLIHFIGVQNDVTEIQNTKKQLEVYTDKLETKVVERTKEIEATVQKLVETNLNLEDQIQVTKLAENKAQRSQDLFAAIAKNFPKGLIVVFNTDFELVYVEGAELKRVNLKKTDFEGKRVDDVPIFSERQIERIKEEVLKTVQGQSLSFEVEFLRNNYAVNSAPIRSDNDDIVQALFVYSNITEQKTIQEELAKALKAEQELNELKSRFISMASHEFRTPLSAILSSAILIGKQNEPGKEERREKHVARIRSHVKHLVVILNDFLSLSKLEEGMVQAKPQNFELIQFCRKLVDEMESIKKEGQTIQLKHIAVEMEVFLDQKLLSHILTNLMSNALKYSDEGQEIVLQLKQDGQMVVFNITDKGIGIPEQEQKYLFDRFFRATNATNIQGTGLGLNIVKQYAELMQGSVSFISKNDMGSTFTAELPLNLLEHEENTTN